VCSSDLVIAAYRKFKYRDDLLPLVLFIPILGAILSGQIFEQKIYWVIFALVISKYETSENQQLENDEPQEKIDTIL
jgi:hypothetical protein